MSDPTLSDIEFKIKWLGSALPLTSISAHINSCTNNRSFVCDICGMGFFTKSKLTGHRRVHTKEAEQEGFHGQTLPSGNTKLGNKTSKHGYLT